MMFSSTW